jgi:hypothetical protein
MFVFRLGLREIIAESGRCADIECKKSSGENKAFNRKGRKLKAAKDAKKSLVRLCVLRGLSFATFAVKSSH